MAVAVMLVVAVIVCVRHRIVRMFVRVLLIASRMGMRDCVVLVCVRVLSHALLSFSGELSGL